MFYGFSGQYVLVEIFGLFMMVDGVDSGIVILAKGLNQLVAFCIVWKNSFLSTHAGFDMVNWFFGYVGQGQSVY